MDKSRYIHPNQILSTLGDNAMMSSFDSKKTNRPTGLSDIMQDVSNFFSNTGKSAENANKITEKVEKGLDKSAPYLIAAGVVFGAMAITQTIKNIQQIEKGA